MELDKKSGPKHGLLNTFFLSSYEDVRVLSQSRPVMVKNLPIVKIPQTRSQSVFSFKNQ